MQPQNSVKGEFLNFIQARGVTDGKYEQFVHTCFQTRDVQIVSHFIFDHNIEARIPDMTEKTDLFAKGGLQKPSQEDGEDAEEEGEYGGEEETPPFPLLQALLLPEDGDAIRRRGLHHQLNDLPSL